MQLANMPTEKTRAPVPRIELPHTYGDLHAFMTVTCNGAFDERRQDFFGNAEFRTLEGSLRTAMSLPDAADEDRRLPNETVIAAKKYLARLTAKEGNGADHRSLTKKVVTSVRELIARAFTRKEGLPNLQ